MDTPRSPGTPRSPRPEAYWVKHPDLVWAPATPEGDGGADAVTFKLMATGVESYEGTSIAPTMEKGDTKLVKTSQLQGMPDLKQLEEADDGPLLHSLRVRYHRDQIYTYVSQMVVAINPYKSMPIYSTPHMHVYRDTDRLSGLDPHIFGLGANAYKGLLESGPQAVLVAGESGAGKTESAKHITSFMVEVASAGPDETIKDKILKVSPVLESFGNARTQRNPNSSRFGRWTRIAMSPDREIQGCEITDYMLELARVCKQGKNDRSYHIFYQLIQAGNDPEFSEYDNFSKKEYKYLKDSQREAPGIDDKRSFNELKQAFGVLGFEQSCQTEIFRVAMGVLTLGNIRFSSKNGSDGCSITKESEADVEQAAKLLGVDAKELSSTLLQKEAGAAAKPSKANKSIAKVPRPAAEAAATRDSIAKLLYGRLFKWLIGKVNKSLKCDAKTDLFFGVLDMASLEKPAGNDLEQLLVNYANELLHQYFVDNFFKKHLEHYKDEDVKVDESMGSIFSDLDNTAVVELLTATGGILPCLDEESKESKDKADDFLSKVHTAPAADTCMFSPQTKSETGKTPTLAFGIKHFAGDVEYTCDQFLSRNQDGVMVEAPGLFKSSSLSILKDLAEQLKTEADATHEHKGAKKKATKTVSGNFQQSLQTLMDKLKQVQPHFVRCIRPGTEEAPMKFTSTLVLEQLRFSGVLEAINLLHRGYATQMHSNEFLEMYAVVADVEGTQDSDSRSFTSKSASPETKKCWKCYNLGCMPEGGFCKCLYGVPYKRPKWPKVIEKLEKMCECPDGKKGLVFGKSKAFLKLDADSLLQQKRRETFLEAKRPFDEMENLLNRAIEKNKAKALKNAISEAESGGYDECELFEQAKEALETCKDEEPEVGDVTEERDEQVEVVEKAEPEKVDGSSPRKVVSFKADDEDAIEKERLEAEEREKAAAEEAAKKAIEEARKAIQEAIASKDPEMMQTAIAQAEEAGLEDTDPDLQQIKGIVRAQKEAERRREVALAEMKSRAEEPINVDALKRAVDEARSVGVAASEVARYQVVLVLAPPMPEAEALENALEDAKGQQVEGKLLDLAKCTLGLLNLLETTTVDETREDINTDHIQEVIEQGELLNANEKLIGRVKRLLETILRMKHARGLARKALTSLDEQALKEALEAMQKAGVPQAEQQEVETEWKAEIKRNEVRPHLEAEARKGEPDSLDFLNALEEGRKVGLSNEELQDYKSFARQEKEGRPIRMRLWAAMEGDQTPRGSRKVNIKKLEDAIQAVQDMQARGRLTFKDHKLDEAIALLGEAKERERMERRELESTLEKAAIDEDAIMLHAALLMAEDVPGLDLSCVSRAKQALRRAEQKVVVLEDLKKAMQSGDVRLLHVAINCCADYDIETRCMTKAKNLLEDLELKQRSKSLIEIALQEKEVAVLSNALSEGRRAGLEESELHRVKLMLGSEQRKAIAVQNLQLGMQSGKHNKLRDALAECRVAEVDDNRLIQDGERKLEFELSVLQQKENLQDAIDSGRVDVLMEAIATARAAGLTPVHLQGFQDRLEEFRAQERSRLQAKQNLQQAISIRNLNFMQGALAECRALRLDDPVVKAAEAILEEEKRKERLTVAIEQAAKDGSEKRLLELLLEAQQCGLSADRLNSVRERLGEEQRKAIARADIQMALNQRSVEALASAINEGQACGLESSELAQARRVLTRVEAVEEQHERLVNAIYNSDLDELRAAIEEAEAIQGADFDLIEDARKKLEDECHKEEARRRLDAAVRDFSRYPVGRPDVPSLPLPVQGPMQSPACSTDRWKMPSPDTEATPVGKGLGQLQDAIIQGEEAGLAPAELWQARELLENETLRLLDEAERRYLKAKESILSPAQELAFELARGSLQSFGRGSLPDKAREAAPVFDVACSEVYVDCVQGLWHAKNGNILTELCTNLRTCVVSKDAKPGSIVPVGKKQLVRLCMELQARYRAMYSSDQVTKYPLLLLCMVLCTQQDVDTDRMLFFPDCPASFLEEREVEYTQYRDCVNAAQETRNPSVPGAASWSAWASWGCLSQGMPTRADEWDQGEWNFVQSRMETWVKLTCLLSAIRPRLDEARTVTRSLVGLPDISLDELRQKQPGESLFWPALLSVTLDEQAYMQPDSRLVAERTVVFQIAGVSEGLELFHASQYPNEREVLLPAFSRLCVHRVCEEPGRPLLVECSYEGCMMPELLRQHCLYDLMEASRELMREVLEQWTPATSIFSCLSSRAGAPSPQPQLGKAAGHYTQEVFKTAMQVFEGMDRRGVWSVSREDYLWATSALSESLEFQRLVLRKEGISRFFAAQNRPRDLSLHRYLCLSMPGANEADMDRMLRWASRYLRRRERRSGRLDEDVVLDDFGEDVQMISLSTPVSRPGSPKGSQHSFTARVGASAPLLSPQGSTVYPGTNHAQSMSQLNTPLSRDTSFIRDASWPVLGLSGEGEGSTSSLNSWRQRQRSSRGGFYTPSSPGARPWR